MTNLNDQKLELELDVELFKSGEPPPEIFKEVKLIKISEI